MKQALLDAIQQGCNTLNLSLTATQHEQLLQYILRMDKWNQVYNLTSVRQPAAMVGRHLMDSLAILPFLEGESLLDVGTGAGLPGIPLAIARPELAVTLIDTNSKKTRFLQQMKAELGLANSHIVHARVEMADLPEYDMVTARAFARIETILAMAGQHCRTGGMLLLMKGIYPEQELVSLPAGYTLRDAVKLDVPGCEGQRHLVRIRKE